MTLIGNRVLAEAFKLKRSYWGGLIQCDCCPLDTDTHKGRWPCEDRKRCGGAKKNFPSTLLSFSGCPINKIDMSQINREKKPNLLCRCIQGSHKNTGPEDKSGS